MRKKTTHIDEQLDQEMPTQRTDDTYGQSGQPMPREQYPDQGQHNKERVAPRLRQVPHGRRGADQRGEEQQPLPPRYARSEQELQLMSYSDVQMYARRLGVSGATLMKKEALIKRILELQLNPDQDIEVEGTLERLPDGFGFLRSARFDYISGPDDCYVSPSQIRRFNLRTGDTVRGVIRKPKRAKSILPY